MEAAAADMDTLTNFEINEGYAVFRPTGQISIGRAVELVGEGIAFARSLNIRKLLVDITNLTGFEPPDVVLRYFLVKEWARAAERIVCVAIVTRPEMIDSVMVDPRKIGTAVAAELGFTSDVFITTEDALNWLESLK